MTVYLDNNATTIPCEESLHALKDTMLNIYANPSSAHSEGYKAKDKLQYLRKKVAKSINAEEKEIIFVSSGSEGNNLAIRGFCSQYKNGKRKHIITSNIEHPSVLKTFEDLRIKDGFDVTYLQVDSQGFVSIDTIKDFVNENTILISIGHCNSEIGTVQEVKKWKECFPNVTIHTDAVQSFLKVPFDVKENKVDLATFSGHKIHAPKGVGFIYKKDGIDLDPVLTGGEQEFGIRAGTESLGMIAALESAITNISSDDIIRMGSLQEFIISELLKIEGTKINGPIHLKKRNCTNINVAFRGHESEAIVKYLSNKGVYVSTRSACSINSKAVSHVLTAIDLDPEYLHGAIRVSTSKYTTREEIGVFLSVLKDYLFYNNPYLISKINEGSVSEKVIK